VISPVQIPVPAGVGEPADIVVFGGHRHQADAGDGALLSPLVAVEHLDADGLSSGERFGDRRVRAVVGIAQRALPEADIPGRDVQVARLGTQFFDGKVIDVAGEEARPDRPRPHDGDARTDVAQAEGQVDDAVNVLGDAAATIDVDPSAVDEHDLLPGIVEPGLHQDRPSLIDERRLGDAGGPVGGPQRPDGHHREGQRPGGGRQRGDRLPVVHAHNVRAATGG
jgi:hypothetical protein